MNGFPRARWLVPSALLLVLSPTPPAWAIPRSWVAGSGNWNTAGNWTPAAVPATGDDVTVAFADGIARTVNYDYAGPLRVLNSLTLDLT